MYSHTQNYKQQSHRTGQWSIYSIELQTCTRARIQAYDSMQNTIVLIHWRSNTYLLSAIDRFYVISVKIKYRNHAINDACRTSTSSVHLIDKYGICIEIIAYQYRNIAHDLNYDFLFKHTHNKQQSFNVSNYNPQTEWEHWRICTYSTYYVA